MSSLTGPFDASHRRNSRMVANETMGIRADNFRFAHEILAIASGLTLIPGVRSAALRASQDGALLIGKDWL